MSGDSVNNPETKSKSVAVDDLKSNDASLSSEAIDAIGGKYILRKNMYYLPWTDEDRKWNMNVKLKPDTIECSSCSLLQRFPVFRWSSD